MAWNLPPLRGKPGPLWVARDCFCTECNKPGFRFHPSLWLTQLWSPSWSNSLSPHNACCLYLPDIHHWSHESRSLEQLRRIVTELPHPQQAQWLKGLSGFIASEDFYQQVKNISAAGDIRHLYLALGQPSGEACIVRSSGVDEDRFGDAQAGRYDIFLACFSFFCFPCL
ncbi:hypothetical protein ACTL6P_21540 [Endozoicomonas acroporae]|uniref:hypothetical protein n=1 Tax=Endozoicomonas acroporae TaxID=1701104 RepID=UPI0013D06955|nr:hypothetical protein [Endozoicomonas acroporae]